MEHYLAERYLPAHLSASLVDDVARVRAAGSSDVRLLESWYVPEDEVCFLLFESASAELVERAMLEASLELARVMQVRR